MPALVVRRLEAPLGVPADKSVSEVVLDPERADLDALITAEGARRLEELAAARIAAASEEGTLAGAPRLQLVLTHWRLWSDVEAVKSWVTVVRRDNEQL